MPNFKMWKSQQLHRLRTDSERLFDQLCSDFGLPSICRPMVAPDLIMRDTPDNLIVEALIPGMDPDIIVVEVDDAVLSLGCKHREACDMLVQSGLLEQRLALPCRIRTEEVTARFDGERLTITMPKWTRPKPRRVPVDIVEPETHTR